jgi:hypothetical protein
MEKVITKKWMGAAPETCDLCGNKLHKVFFDAKTSRGPWGILCLPCFAMEGGALGTGAGQKYSLTTGEKLGG